VVVVVRPVFGPSLIVRTAPTSPRPEIELTVPLNVQVVDVVAAGVLLDGPVGDDELPQPAQVASKAATINFFITVLSV
jgi:hypothetical protein